MREVPKERLNDCRLSLKINRSVYENLPAWYRVLADYLSLHGRVEIVADEKKEVM